MRQRRCGVDPNSGEQVGPTDAEIRFGLLEPWLKGKAGVAAELNAFLENNRAQLDTTVKPIILLIGEKYLSLRP